MTPRLVARFRPGAQIIGAVEDPVIARRLLLSYGITPLLLTTAPDVSAEEFLRAAQHAALKEGFLHEGEAFLFTSPCLIAKGVVAEGRFTPSRP